MQSNANTGAAERTLTTELISHDSQASNLRVAEAPVAICDPEDFPFLSRFKWCVERVGDMQYAATHIGGRAIYMQHLVMMAYDPTKFFHLDGNGLNNCRANLRRPIRTLTGKTKLQPTFQYKGVTKGYGRSNWRAEISVEGKTKSLGLFDTAEAAARAYDVAAREIHGEFAYQNFPRRPS